MSLARDIVENVTGFSKAMYSTWFFYRPARLLFDSGEGVSTTMDNFSFGIEKIFISHGHYDHIGGLPGLIHARNSGRGDKEKALKIFYPAGDSLIRAMKEYIGRISYRLTYDLEWEEIKEGDEVPLRTGGKQAFVRAFRTRHSRSARTLGYALMEKRSRLKTEFAALGEEEIHKKVMEGGRNSVMEEYQKILLAYGGDSLALDPEQIADAEVVIHDATFLNEKDREEPTHATSEEAIRAALEARAGMLLLHHISSRYSADRISQTVYNQAQSIAPELKVMIAVGHSIFSAKKRNASREPAHA